MKRPRGPFDSMLTHLAAALNLPVEGLRIVVSLQLAILFAYFHRTCFYNAPARTQHAFLAGGGLLLLSYNFGWDCAHLVFSGVVVWAVLQLFDVSEETVVGAHCLFLGHLLVGYVLCETDNYDISWTTAYCVMCLRHIGLVTDVYDQTKKARKAHTDPKKPIVLQPKPDLLEVLAYGLNPLYSLTGPQVSLKRFRSWIKGEFCGPNKEPRDSSWDEFTSCMQHAVIYTVIHIIGVIAIPNSYLNSENFYKSCLLFRILVITLWARVTLAKYASVFLFSEAACVLSTLSYNGPDRKNPSQDLWNACRSFDVMLWETGTDFSSCVASFNIQTNAWMKNYVFRRLRFLGNKHVSHAATLFYLAIWHGFHFGYFMLFGFEFFGMRAQNEFYELMKSPNIAPHFKAPNFLALRKALGWVWLRVVMGAAMLPFGLLTFASWIGPLSSVYFFPYVLYVVVAPAFFFLAHGFQCSTINMAADESTKSSVSSSKSPIERKG